MNKSKTKGTLEYFTGRSWNRLNSRTINGAHPQKCQQKYLDKGVELRVSKTLFYDWCRSQWPIIQSLYLSKKTPSIDRIDPKGHYELSNMQIIDKRLNDLQGLKNATPAGRLLRIRPVSATTFFGGRIEAASITDLAKILGLNSQNISRDIRKPPKKPRTYRFEFITISSLRDED